MENMSIWKTIKTGFWIGVGFIIPLLISVAAATAAAYTATYLAMKDSFDEGIEGAMSDYDRTSQIEILDYRERLNGEQLLILGTLKNTGADKASSISLEAELYDADGQMVYECNEHINESIQPGNTENFQIRCGCGDNLAPEHASVEVSVTSAHSY